ncbi:MAG: hypothetical protein K8963_01450, partial [Proteobacteria bacterium]|nr:hypothetical protein [Pseudomonadota bacterium]
PPLGRDPSTSTPATKPIRQSQSAQLPTRKQSQPTDKAAKASNPTTPPPRPAHPSAPHPPSPFPPAWRWRGDGPVPGDDGALSSPTSSPLRPAPHLPIAARVALAWRWPCTRRRWRLFIFVCRLFWCRKVAYFYSRFLLLRVVC